MTMRYALIRGSAGGDLRSGKQSGLVVMREAAFISGAHSCYAARNTEPQVVVNSVHREGIEPSTLGLRVPCSAN